MSAHLGLSAPVLAPLSPVTGTFALPFTAYFSFLSFRVVSNRLSDKAYLGDNSSKSSDPAERNQNKLYLATRSHQNFIENVPLALVLAAVAELNGGNRKALTGVLGTLFVLRVLHAELGMMGNGMGTGRPIGYFGTLATLGGLAGYAAYLVKAYWGF
ncbi:Uu.00g058850.m01.CDS01 [Anthostomella pinea]|uniref:Uu.00g058850.m01.CDS01 n=1 Tax=Anthostomella pinea TaxID=933095 RepID=A0AAI8VLD3_9PEZI|nr:Uu.00g058850.m01.CDS01 [Anthostomella pinea]